MNLRQDVPYHYVHTSVDLSSLASLVGRARRVGLDTEGDSLHHYYQKVCLIQLVIDEQVYLVDPLGGGDMAPLLEALAAVPLVMHSADSDLRMLRGSFEIVTQGEVFDTMVAAQLLGYEQIGLASLVLQFFDVELPKTRRKSDWSRRPLEPMQLQYASDDVRYLFPLIDTLQGELVRLGRIDWHIESCQRAVELSRRDKPPEDPDKVWRIKGVKGLNRHELAFVKEAWHWRERQARRADLPPFKIMNNSLIIDLATWMARHPTKPLSQGPKLPRHCTGQRLASLGRALDKARALPKTDWPERLRPQFGSPPPEVPAQALRTRCARVAHGLGIEPSVLAPRLAMETVAARRPDSVERIMSCSSLMRWQATLIAPEVAAFLAEHPAQ